MKDTDGRTVPEVALTDDAGALINSANPLPVELQVVPTISIATIQLQGDDTAVISGSKSTAAWDGAAASPTWTAIFKYMAAQDAASASALGATGDASSASTAIGLLKNLKAAIGAPGDAVGANTVIGQLKQIAANTTP